ncbi:claudin-like protein ZF-A89 isoform X1 [Epinephelus fuscoguttatus]|uniref:claudin-like protein ZF-A89 isoform X1 n=1 Tax=Epinephelus fuscoguttatus TaxID=293821 RepID=UPI0020D150C6|nr:claudin-like protein ZF-A89 isoform X1 [Epinephelus fuscoguttatus]
MVSMGRQMLGFALAIIGFLGTIIVCALPMWKVTAFIGANIVTAQVIWEGLWMNCVMQSTGQMQCKIYDSLLALPQDLQAARALVVIAIIVAAFGVILGIAGGKCTNFVEEPRAKAKVAIAAGIVFICAGVLILIPVCWSANTIIRDFYNPIITNAQRREETTMASMAMQMAGCVLALFGWIGVLIVCGTPMWRVTAFIGNNIVTSQVMWEGIWMSCVVQSTGQMQCKVYDSMLALSTDLQGARALVVVSIVVGLAGILIAFAGGKCTNFIPEERAKARASVAAGVLLIISGILCIIPVSWTASIIIRNFYNPVVVDAQKRELGATLYIGWGAGALLVLGGALLCANCPHKEDEAPSVKYLLNQPGGYSKDDSYRSNTPTKTYI